MAVIHQIITSDPPSIRRYVPAIDDELERVIMTTLQRDPSRRFQRVEQIATELKRIQARLATDETTTTLQLPKDPRPGQNSEPTTAVTQGTFAGRGAEALQIRLAAAQQLLDDGSVAQALAEVEGAAMLDPADRRVVSLLERCRTAAEEEEVRAWLAAGVAELSGGRPERAKDLADRALQRRPELAEAVALIAKRNRLLAERSRQLARVAATRRALEQARASFAEGGIPGGGDPVSE